MYIARLAWLSLFAACVPAEVETSLTEQPIIETFIRRHILTSPDVIHDWTGERMIDPAIAANGTLRVRVCSAHLGVSSQARANLVAAINAHHTAGVAIDITEIASAVGTATHPDLTTFAFPTDAIYVDYDDRLPAGTFSSTWFPPGACDASSPKRCSQARIYINPDLVPVGDAPSEGVFMHELGHAFGMQDINNASDLALLLDPGRTMALDRTVVHGKNLHSDDFRSTLVHAATLAYLQHHYPKPNAPGLTTNEIVAHRNMTVTDERGSRHIEINPSKSYVGNGTAAYLIYDRNETSLRWDEETGTFRSCFAQTSPPVWLTHFSEASTNTVNTPFQVRFQVSTQATGGPWTTIADRVVDSHEVSLTPYRQFEWERSLIISAAEANVAGGAGITTMTRRRLRFQVDATNALAERNEGNNEWWVNLCLYPASIDCSVLPACAQP